MKGRTEVLGRVTGVIIIAILVVCYAFCSLLKIVF